MKTYVVMRRKMDRDKDGMLPFQIGDSEPVMVCDDRKRAKEIAAAQKKNARRYEYFVRQSWRVER